MESDKRPSFFVQNPDSAWRRQNFSLIADSGKISELARHVMGLEQKAIIREFIDDHFGDTFEIERKTPNPADLATKFEYFKDNKLVDAVDVKRVLIEALTFEDIVQFSQLCHDASKKVVGSMIVDSEDSEFVYWQDVHNIMKEAYEIKKANDTSITNVIRIDWTKKLYKDPKDPTKPSA